MESLGSIGGGAAVVAKNNLFFFFGLQCLFAKEGNTPVVAFIAKLQQSKKNTIVQIFPTTTAALRSINPFGAAQTSAYPNHQRWYARMEEAQLE